MIDGLQAYPLKAFEEKPKPARAEELAKQTGVAWNAGMFVWRRRAIRAAFERYSGLIGLLEPTIRAPALLAHAYEQLKPVSIDVAPHGECGPRRARRDGRDGRRMVRHRQLDGAPRRHLGRWHADPSSSPATGSTWMPTTWSCGAPRGPFASSGRSRPVA